MKSMKKQTYTFLELLEDFDVCIPIIQRDYAHGRDNTRAEDVRTMLVKDLWKTVTESIKGLHLDFIYGRIDGACLIPFDGQQRLTTLFLFHRYLYEKEKGKEWEGSDEQQLLKKFSYATRPSARDFCEALCDNSTLGDSKTPPCIDDISDAKWFDVSWLDDPTVKSMIRVLKTIHEKAPAAEKLDLGGLNRITFTLADMGELNMGDTSYISMNATGRPLTAWENFKASYFQFLTKGEKANHQEKGTEIDENINTIWTDFFFVKSREKGETNTGSFDHLMMEMVQLYLFNHQEFEYEKGHIKEEKLEIPYPGSKHDKYIPFSSYKNVLEKHKLNPLFNFWDYLHNHKDKDENLRKWEPIWSRDKEKPELRIWEAGKFSHKERVAFHACILLFHDSSEISPGLLGEWMRIIWNILENSQVDSVDTYKTYIKLVDTLHEKIFKKEGSEVDSDKKLLEHISDITPSDFSAAPQQLEEEKNKAELILKGDKQTRENIINAEKHPWCKGKISVLLNAAKENEEKLSDVYNRLDRIRESVTSSETRVDALKKTVDLLLYHNSIADKLWESEIAFPKENDEQWKDEINKHPELLWKIWRELKSEHEPPISQNEIDSIYQKHQHLRTLTLSHKQIFSSYVRFWLCYDGFRIATKPRCRYQNCYYMDAYGELEALCMEESISIGWAKRSIYSVTKVVDGVFRIDKKEGDNKSAIYRLVCPECFKKLEGDTFEDKLNSLFRQPDNEATADTPTN